MDTNNQLPLEEKKQPQRSSSKSAGLVLFRLLLTVIVAVILGIVIYYSAAGGIPILSNKILQPIEENQSQVMEIQETQKAQESQLFDISATLEFFEQSNYQATIITMEEDIQILAEDLVSAQATMDINSQMNMYMSTVYPQMLFDLEEKIASNSRNLGALATAQMGSIDIEGDLKLIRILEQLSLVNQFLLHSNFGLAKDTLILAKDDLLELQQSSLGFQKEFIVEITDLVEGAIADLPTKPDLAADKVELAFQLSINGLPKLDQSDLNITRTPTPYSPGFTPSPTAP